MRTEPVTSGEVLDRVFLNNFNLDDADSLREDDEGSLGAAFAVLAVYRFAPERTKEERVSFAEELISKIDKSSFSEKANYNLASALGNCGARGKNSVAAIILQKIVESKKFDVGAVFVASNKEKKDALEATVQQSVIGDIRKWSRTQSQDQLNKFFISHPKGDGDVLGLYEANKEISMILLSSGQVAGFEGDAGVEMAEKIKAGGFDFRALVGRDIPNRDESKIEAWSKAQSENSSGEVEVRGSSSVLRSLVSAACSCFSFSRLSSGSRYYNPSVRS